MNRLFSTAAIARSVRPASSLFINRPSSLLFAKRTYATDLDPANSKDYNAYVQLWQSHFSTCEDDFELERGLNHIFSADWVPSYEVVVEAIKASRRLNTFATAVRILEALENKVENKVQYEAYIKELRPVLDELGIPERKELGEFKAVRDPSRWWY